MLLISTGADAIYPKQCISHNAM